MNSKNILIIAGEPSGDMRAGELLEELAPRLPEASFWGIGGERMRSMDVDLTEHIRDLSIVGVWEAVKRLPMIRRQYKNCVSNIEKRRPSAAILIDYPGFNLAVAKYLHDNGIPVIYYIIPQVWAWGAGRVKLLKRYTDKILVLFDFEKRFLANFGVSSEFVGHPLVDKMPLPPDDGSRPARRIALLAGSRKSEVTSLLPIMLDAAEKMNKTRKGLEFVLAESSNVGSAVYDRILETHGDLAVTRVKDDTPASLAASDLAIVASGTATLETAMMERPFVIIYKASILTFILYHLVSKTKYIGLANIVAGKEIAPELLQYEATPEKISRKLSGMMNSSVATREIRRGLKKVRLKLGEKGASRRAAEAIRIFLEKIPKH